jgi:ABC-type multidrug transport system ATPase subunit
LLVLGEPTNGLDPAGIIERRTLLQTFAARPARRLTSSAVRRILISRASRNVAENSLR